MFTINTCEKKGLIFVQLFRYENICQNKIAWLVLIILAWVNHHWKRCRGQVLNLSRRYFCFHWWILKNQIMCWQNQKSIFKDFASLHSTKMSLWKIIIYSFSKIYDFWLIWHRRPQALHTKPYQIAETRDGHDNQWASFDSSKSKKKVFIFLVV